MTGGEFLLLALLALCLLGGPVPKTGGSNYNPPPVRSAKRPSPAPPAKKYPKAGAP